MERTLKMKGKLGLHRGLMLGCQNYVLFWRYRRQELGHRKKTIQCLHNMETPLYKPKSMIVLVVAPEKVHLISGNPKH